MGDDLRTKTVDIGTQTTECVLLGTSTSEIWEKISSDKSAVGWQLPYNYKLLLEFYGYSTLYSLGQLEAQDIDFIEEDARTRFDESQRESYLGVQARNPDKFKIFPGFRKLILAAAEICRCKKFLGKELVTKISSSPSNKGVQPESANAATISVEKLPQVGESIKRLAISAMKNAKEDISREVLDVAETMTVEVDVNGKNAEVVCPVSGCGKSISVSKPKSRNSWVVSNLIAHLKARHGSNINRKGKTTSATKKGAAARNTIAEAFKRGRITSRRRLSQENANSGDEDDVVSLDSNDDDDNTSQNFMKGGVQEGRSTSPTQSKSQFDRADKEFFTWVYIQGGRHLYETLHANAPKGMPSLATLLKFQGNVMEPVIEGMFRWQELSDYLRENDLPRVIALSEDGTRITGKIEYDPISNRLVGFAAPLDENGLPDTDHYIASGEKAMAAMFATAPRAHTAYVLMAKPLLQGAAAFCLAAFGTDNRFKAEGAVRRWRWLKQTAERYNIAIDTVHIGTKFRTGFCNRGKTYLMGNYCATVNHLEHIINTVPKLQHGLTLTDLNHADKMNFTAVLRITDERVCRLLRGKDHYSGTEMFLTVVRDVLEAYLDEELPTEDRIFQMWRAVFFLRIWREWLLQNDHRLDQCFITTNTFQSVELNAHALIQLLRILRDGSHSEQFLPHLFGSQQCEKLFRALRSLTTTHATVVNFSMLKMLARVRRVELQARVVSSVGDTFTFPREEKKQVKAEQTAARRSALSGGLPSDEEILVQIDLARSEAKNCAALLGMNPDMDETIPAPMYGSRGLDLDVDDAEDEEAVEGVEAVEEAPDSDDQSPPPERMACDDFDPDDVALNTARLAWSTGEEVRPFPPESHKMLYTKPNGVKVPILKTTYCWIHNKGGRLSADRLQRYSSGLSAATGGGQQDRVNSITRRAVIEVDEWCTFRKGPRGRAPGAELQSLEAKPQKQSPSIRAPEARGRAPERQGPEVELLRHSFRG
ncbi:hypothetical protein FOCC_FOCC016345 [Frankliniella occidentalis]|nr:hypothetical protein FOCC_FOCC016345 [Frankliniella occidentalis]